jgi:hypothetical protein
MHAFFDYILENMLDTFRCFFPTGKIEAAVEEEDDVSTGSEGRGLGGIWKGL